MFFGSSRAVLCLCHVLPASAGGCAGTLGTITLETRLDTTKPHLVDRVNCVWCSLGRPLLPRLRGSPTEALLRTKATFLSAPFVVTLWVKLSENANFFCADVTFVAAARALRRAGGG